jgi:hypothetical protein
VGLGCLGGGCPAAGGRLPVRTYAATSLRSLRCRVAQRGQGQRLRHSLRLRLLRPATQLVLAQLQQLRQWQAALRPGAAGRPDLLLRPRPRLLTRRPCAACQRARRRQPAGPGVVRQGGAAAGQRCGGLLAQRVAGPPSQHRVQRSALLRRHVQHHRVPCQHADVAVVQNKLQLRQLLLLLARRPAAALAGGGNGGQQVSDVAAARQQDARPGGSRRQAPRYVVALGVADGVVLAGCGGPGGLGEGAAGALQRRQRGRQRPGPAGPGAAGCGRTCRVGSGAGRGCCLLAWGWGRCYDCSALQAVHALGHAQGRRGQLRVHVLQAQPHNATINTAHG